MGEYKPLLTYTALLIILSSITSAIVTATGLTINADSNSFGAGLISFINNGIGIFGFNLNIVPAFSRDYFAGIVTGLYYLPLIIQLPIIILAIFGLTYAIIKALPTT